MLNLVGSLVAGRFMQRVGRSITLRVGTLMQAVACLLFISLEWAEEVYLFLIIGFSGRMISGVGAGLLTTAGNLINFLY